MPSTTRFPWPQRTTAVAGVLLLISAVLLLLVRAQASLPVTDTFVIPLAGPAVSVGAAITRAAGFVVLARGVAGEIGIAADSRVGTAALVVWGFRDLVGMLQALIPVDAGMVPVYGVLGTALMVLFTAAAVVATVAVVRARVLSGFARWALLPAATVDCASLVLSGVLLATPVATAVQTALLTVPLELLDPVLVGLLAVALLLWSRTEAVKHRARLTYDAW